MAVALCVAMLSLAGIPPTAGFVAKFRLFGAVVERGRELGGGISITLVVVAILSSLVSLGYYLRVIVVMYMREPDAAHRDHARASAPPSGRRSCC